jgi:hypothetical protein
LLDEFHKMGAFLIFIFTAEHAEHSEELCHFAPVSKMPS